MNAKRFFTVMIPDIDDLWVSMEALIFMSKEASIDVEKGVSKELETLISNGKETITRGERSFAVGFSVKDFGVMGIQ